MTQVYLAVLAPEAGEWTHALLAKKRVTNRWWGGKLLLYPAAVNQAGQWALPGGEKKGTEHQREAAKREFQEETGYDLHIDFAHGAVVDYPFSAAGEVLAEDQLFLGVRFYLVVLRVSTEQQSKICTAANTSIGPKMVHEVPSEPTGPTGSTGSKMKPRVLYKKPETKPYVPTVSLLQGPLVASDRPFSSQIQDWELSSLQVVARQVLGTLLGVSSPLGGLSPSDTQLIQQSSHDSQDISWYAAMATHLTTKVA